MDTASLPSAFPYKRGDDIAALSAQAGAILSVFEGAGYERNEPAVLQPAELFLDRSGEEIRLRTFTLTDPSGRELALRPDLTIPICKAQVDAGAPFPARVCYNSAVFRHRPGQPDRPTQFYQAGAELLGAPNAAEADAEIMRLTIAALRAAGVADFDMLVGDLGLFGALVDAMDVPAKWRARLKRHFWHADTFAGLLARLTGGDGKERVRLLESLAGLSPEAARAEIAALIVREDASPLAGRSVDEIVARLMAEAEEARHLHLDPRLARVMTEMLAVSGPARDALEQVRALALGAGVSLDAPLSAMHARLSALASLGIDPARVRFAARFGRNMEYYTGFVFEMWTEDAEGRVQIAGGGRYDTLLQQLGAGRAVPAIGCALRTERVLAVRRFREGRA